jgi:hypothetical protein
VKRPLHVPISAAAIRRLQLAIDVLRDPQLDSAGTYGVLGDEAIAGREHEVPLVGAEIARLIIGRSESRRPGSAQAQIFFSQRFLRRFLGARASASDGASAAEPWRKRRRDCLLPEVIGPVPSLASNPTCARV